MKVDPRPVVEVTSTRPPCARAIRLIAGSPNPAPWGLVLKKGLNILPYNNRECLHCHLGARSFEESEAHTKDPQRLSLIKANQMSCSTSECHNIIHNVGQLKDATFWKEQGK